MKTMFYAKSATLAAVILASSSLQACKDESSAQQTTAQDQNTAHSAQQVADNSCFDCGEIIAIEQREVEGDASPAAAVAGAIVGGVIGHQFGSGSGNDAATAAGAVGGAVAGNEIQKNRDSHIVYDVTIDMDHGPNQEVTLASLPNVEEGDRVEVREDRVAPI